MLQQLTAHNHVCVMMSTQAACMRTGMCAGMTQQDALESVCVWWCAHRQLQAPVLLLLRFPDLE